MAYSVWSGQRTLLIIFGISLLCSLAVAQQASASASTTGEQKATHLVGLTEVKQNVNGKLVIGSESLTFASAKTIAQIPIASIEDVFTGQDSRQTGGKPLTVAKMAVPYGGGRVLSLFAHEKFDSLTVEYRDSNGGLHAAIFRLRQGGAAQAKKQLIAMGAKTGNASETTFAAAPEAAKEEKQ